MDSKQLKEKLKKLYLEGKTRKEAMVDTGLETNQIASQSTQLKLRWSWPLENRVSGQPPDAQQPLPKKREVRPGRMVTVRRPPESAAAAETKAPEPPAHAAAQTPKENSLTLPARRNWGPPTGWVSSAKKWELGIREPVPGDNEFEKFLHSEYAKQNS